MNSFNIKPPREFSFEQALHFLQRSPRELLHRVVDDKVLKLVLVKQRPLLFSVASQENELKIEFLNDQADASDQVIVEEFVTEWFDLVTDLKPFYALAANDELLHPLVKEYYGYRIIGQPDLFESLVWAVIGQQINLPFAYTLKQRFVENWGHRVIHQNTPYYLFPNPETVSQLTDEDLLPLKFSRQKSKYTIGIARAFAEGAVSKGNLKGWPLKEARDELMKLKGVGNWTANYALMKTYRYPNAFPLEDAGVHNAIKNLLGLRAKPSIPRVQKLFKKYKGWEAYATLYLWRSL